jgi:hypothetical protein
MPRRPLPTAGLLAVLLCGPLWLASADADHELAREALESGRILSLSEILERVRGQFAGEFLEAELEREDDGPLAGRLVYEIELLAPDGVVTELYLDAATGKLLRAHGHDLGGHRARDHDSDAGYDGYEGEHHEDEHYEDDGDAR